MDNARSIITAIKTEDPHAASQAFDVAISSRIKAAIDDRKIEVGRQMFVSDGDSSDE